VVFLLLALGSAMIRCLATVVIKIKELVSYYKVYKKGLTSAVIKNWLDSIEEKLDAYS
jgi:hypothetical protein